MGLNHQLHNMKSILPTAIRYFLIFTSRLEMEKVILIWIGNFISRLFVILMSETIFFNKPEEVLHPKEQNITRKAKFAVNGRSY